MQISSLGNKHYTSDQPTPINKLSSDVLCKHIFLSLPIGHLAHIPLVCKRWNTICLEAKKQALKDYFPSIQIDQNIAQQFNRLLRINSRFFSESQISELELKGIFIKFVQAQSKNLYLFSRCLSQQTFMIKPVTYPFILCTKAVDAADITVMHVFDKKVFLGDREGVIHSSNIEGDNIRGYKLTNRSYIGDKQKPITFLKASKGSVYFTHEEDSQVSYYSRGEHRKLNRLGEEINNPVTYIKVKACLLLIGHENGMIEGYDLSTQIPTRYSLEITDSSIKKIKMIKDKLFIGCGDGTIKILGTEKSLTFHYPNFQIQHFVVYENWIAVAGVTTQNEYAVYWSSIVNRQDFCVLKTDEEITNLMFDSNRLILTFALGGYRYIEYPETSFK